MSPDEKDHMSRPVHYHASGRRSPRAPRGGAAFRFACWQDEFNEHRASAYTVPSKAGSFTITRYRKPRPLRHTDLTQVTCRACWLDIVSLSRTALLRLGAT